MRSGTLDTPAIVGLRRGRRGGRQAPARSAPSSSPGCATTWSPGARGRARRGPRRRPRPDAGAPAARQRALLLPRLRGRRAAAAARRARASSARPGRPARPGVPQPSHVLLAMGVPEALARGSLRFSLGHTSTPADVDAVVEAIGPVVERRAGQTAGQSRASRDEPRSPMRVLAAMSGGVDSAVAAARAVDAGHDVTGVHLALSSNPQSFRTGARGCCTLEDARDARRAADVIGIPFYVWDLAERFRAGRGRRLRRGVRRRPHAQPVPALQREDQVRGGARQGAGAGLRRGLHRPLRPASSTAGCCRAVDAAKDQSYVLGVLTAAPAGARDVPARRHPQGARYAARPTRAGPGRRRQAGQPRHLLHRRRRHRGLPARAARREPGAGRRHRRRRRSASTTVPTRSPSASARGCGSAGRRPTAGRATCSTSRR